MVLLLERSKLVVEGAGAVAVAALMHGRVSAPDEGSICAVLSGGNVDVSLLSEAIRLGETAAGRRMVLSTVVPGQAGRPGGAAARRGGPRRQRRRRGAPARRHRDPRARDGDQAGAPDARAARTARRSSTPRAPRASRSGSRRTPDAIGAGGCGGARRGGPVVALESTIISHGLPRPRNLEVARQVEAAVREAGAVPATIAVVAGEACVGLDDDALRGDRRARDVVKCGVRDLAPVGRARRLWRHDRRRDGASRRAARASASSRPAGSAAFTATRATPGTSRPTSRRSRASASWSSARA